MHKFFYIAIMVSSSLAITGCSTTFDPARGSKKTLNFLAVEPIKCNQLGKDKYAGCIDEEEKPGRECLKFRLGGGYSFSDLDASCVATKYPECYNSSTNKVSQKCIENIADLKDKQRREIEKKKRLDEESAKMEREARVVEAQKIRAEYDKSPEGIAKQKARAAGKKDLTNACNHFLSDLSRKIAFKAPRLLNAVNAMPNVVMCTYQVTAPGVYVDIPTVITITGNTQNYVYEYRSY